jgi:hypothetical protein
MNKAVPLRDTGGVLLRLQSEWLADHSISSQSGAKYHTTSEWMRCNLTRTRYGNSRSPKTTLPLWYHPERPIMPYTIFYTARREIVPRPKKDASIMYIYSPKRLPLRDSITSARVCCDNKAGRFDHGVDMCVPPVLSVPRESVPQPQSHTPHTRLYNTQPQFPSLASPLPRPT